MDNIYKYRGQGEGEKPEFAEKTAESPRKKNMGALAGEFCACVSIPQVARKKLQKTVIFNKKVIDKWEMIW